MSRSRRIGVDTGGTFTDCVLLDDEANEVRVAKVPSEPSRPQAAILHGIDQLGTGATGGNGGDSTVESVTHGTTIATNAVLTGDLARAGLITTRGFRDVLEVGTQMRPRLYDLRQTPLPAMIPRDLRIEVGGRIDALGREIEPLDIDEVGEAIDLLTTNGVEAIAVACVFAFVNPEHERAIQALVAERAPNTYVGRSSRISQEPREYPRFATAAVNAALAPRLDPYIRALEARLERALPGTRLFVMQSNGGVGTAARTTGEATHQLILSGPAAGVIGGAREGAAAGFKSCVTFDVGGTSADIGVVIDSEPRSEIEMTLPNGVPCKVPHIEVVTIGAGGGSIAAVDAGGALTVGPQSAGAVPGPACYGRGGELPTVTDAHLVLGRLSTAGLIGGELPLDGLLAREATSAVATGLGTSIEDAALGILAVLEENTAGAIRQAAARHGDDLREFALVAGGGAGPLHAAAIMRALGMPAAIVPPYPGLLSALGLLGSNIRHDHVAPLLGMEGELSDDELAATFERLEREANIWLAEDGVAERDRRFDRALDVRYLGQEYTLRVPVAPDDGLEATIAGFHLQHERTFGYGAPGVRTEVVAARLVGIGLRPTRLPRSDLPAAHAEPAASRDVLFDAERGPVATAIFRRGELALGQRVGGPAIIEQLDTTTVVPPGCAAGVAESGSLVITESETDSE